MLWQSTSDVVAKRAAMFGIHNNAQIIKRILADAAKWKPTAYNSLIAKRRGYYTGEQTSYLRGVLKAKFPQTHSKITPFTVNIFQHVTDQISTMYAAAPQRQLHVARAVDTEATQLIIDLYDAGMIDAGLHRIEQIASACKLAFGRVGYDDTDGKMSITPFWPDKVHVDFDPNYPTRIDRANYLIAEIASAAGVGVNSTKRYELWSNTGAGWERSIEDGKGSSIKDDGPLHSRLPWIAVPYEAPYGPLFELPPSDDIDTQDAINVLYSDLLYTIEMQAFTQLVYKGSEDPGPQVGGPGTILVGAAGGEFTTINYNPSIEAVQKTADDLICRLLVLKNVPPSTAKADPSYLSGVALKTERSALNEARAARRPVYRDIEQHQLWPIVRDVVLPQAGISGLDKHSMSWSEGELQLPLDDEAAFRLSQAYVATSVSTFPQEMVSLGKAPSIEKAKELYQSNLDYNKANPVTVGVPFLRSASIAPTQIVDDGANDIE